ncbi:MAG: PhzF family phenazine biosynthesis isomerase [Actinomycetota bacterium]
MKRVRIKQVDTFTSVPFAGNPIAVVTEGDELTEDEMVKIAREMDLQTAFILKPTERKADFKVRFYTPRTEVNLLSHASIAAVHTLVEEARFFPKGPVMNIAQQTKAGILPVEIHCRGAEIRKIMITQVKPVFAPFKGSLQRLADVLGINTSEITGAGFPVEIVSTSLPKLMVPLKHLSALQEMKPDFNSLAQLDEDIGACTHVFTLETISPIAVVHTRSFAPKLGILEEVASGIANGALGAYLVKNKIIRGNSPLTLIAEQGHVLNRPSEIIIELHFTDTEVHLIKVGGKAVTVFEGEIFL